MVERRPVRPSNLTRISPPAPVTPGPKLAADRSGAAGCLIVAALIGFGGLVSKCSSTPATNTGISEEPANIGNAQEALAAAVTAQTPPPVERLSRASVRRGAGRVTLAAREGLAGEMIYSQNCYDALGRTFSWRKLDECGGFDAAAAIALGDNEVPGAEKGVAWFASEEAAGRYLKAAVAAGEDPDEADQRLSKLDSQAAPGSAHEGGH